MLLESVAFYWLDGLQVNPYKHLYIKVRALLNAESKLNPDERKANEWILSCQAGAFKIIVGKGDVNTIFYKFGDSARKVCYPDEILEKLERLGKRDYWYYTLGDAIFLSETLALKQKPVGSICGVNESTVTVYRAKPTLTGAEWVKVK